jgi:hypothetical protein
MRYSVERHIIWRLLDCSFPVPVRIYVRAHHDILDGVTVMLGG